MVRQKGIKLLSVIIVLASIGGCATVPVGPSVAVFPAPGKPFEQFQAEDAICRQWAAQQTGISPQETVNQNTASGAVAGTVIGGGLGAAIGSAGGHVGSGAAIGAATGLLFGTLAGSDWAYASGRNVQRRYDIAYQQCMYSKGNQVPAMAEPNRRMYRRGYVAPPPPNTDSGVPPDYPGGNGPSSGPPPRY
ncbi:MAG TPA: YMGG-like glycine zipper-containing protein [Dissulfurispiraceae bacterium]|nr:YMGG-like glycine zipper-containing protein [Dissulfurispiraceae bacterium]